MGTIQPTEAWTEQKDGGAKSLLSVPDCWARTSVFPCLQTGTYTFDSSVLWITPPVFLGLQIAGGWSQILGLVSWFCFPGEPWLIHWPFAVLACIKIVTPVVHIFTCMFLPLEILLKPLITEQTPTTLRSQLKLHFLSDSVTDEPSVPQPIKVSLCSHRIYTSHQ